MREGERRVLRRERDGDREGGGSEGRECFKLRELEKKEAYKGRKNGGGLGRNLISDTGE